MKVEKKLFGETIGGKEVFRFFISNSKGMKAVVMNYGAILTGLFVPNKKGKIDDIVLGYETLEEYYVNSCFFGTTIGPNANRIAEARFAIDGNDYQLKINDGNNNLHSDENLGFHKRIWEYKEDNDSITFYLESEDMDIGFPGNKKVSVTYTLTEDNELHIDYYGTSDKKTILNFTNHSYFNLAGEGSKNVYDELMWIKASHYTPVVAGAIPTGEIAAVEGTPMDFTIPKKVGKEIDADFEQLRLNGGYDHNWVIDDYDGKLQLIARVEDKEAERTMEVYTTLPGVQFYAGNYVDNEKGKNGHTYNKREALCLETQYFPNAVNEPSFLQPVFGAGKDYHSTTIYKFV